MVYCDPYDKSEDNQAVDIDMTRNNNDSKTDEFEKHIDSLEN